VSNIDFPILTAPSDNVGELQYNNVDTTLYGLHYDASDSLEYLVSIDQMTGVHTPLYPIYDVYGIVGAPHFTTLDEINGRFIFKAFTTSGEERLYSIDIYTGAVISDPIFPILEDPTDNVKELKFNNGNGRLYGLHWDSDWVEIVDTTVMDTTVMDTTMVDTMAMDTTMVDTTTFALEYLTENVHLQISPNPVQDMVRISWEGLIESNQFTIEIVDIDGKICRKEVITDKEFTLIDLSELQAGNYFCRLYNPYTSFYGQSIEERFIKL